MVGGTNTDVMITYDWRVLIADLVLDRTRAQREFGRVDCVTCTDRRINTYSTTGSQVSSKTKSRSPIYNRAVYTFGKMTVQWLAISSFLYAEIFVTLLLILPILKPSW